VEGVESDAEEDVVAVRDQAYRKQALAYCKAQFPYLSSEAIMLGLRHFKYDFTRTYESLTGVQRHIDQAGNADWDNRAIPVPYNRENLVLTLKSRRNPEYRPLIRHADLKQEIDELNRNKQAATTPNHPLAAGTAPARTTNTPLAAGSIKTPDNGGTPTTPGGSMRRGIGAILSSPFRSPPPLPKKTAERKKTGRLSGAFGTLAAAAAKKHNNNNNNKASAGGVGSAGSDDAGADDEEEDHFDAGNWGRVKMTPPPEDRFNPFRRRKGRGGRFRRDGRYQAAETENEAKATTTESTPGTAGPKPILLVLDKVEELIQAEIDIQNDVDFYLAQLAYSLFSTKGIPYEFDSQSESVKLLRRILKSGDGDDTAIISWADVFASLFSEYKEDEDDLFTALQRANKPNPKQALEALKQLQSHTIQFAKPVGCLLMAKQVNDEDSDAFKLKKYFQGLVERVLEAQVVGAPRSDGQDQQQQLGRSNGGGAPAQHPRRDPRRDRPSASGSGGGDDDGDDDSNDDSSDDGNGSKKAGGSKKGTGDDGGDGDGDGDGVDSK